MDASDLDATLAKIPAAMPRLGRWRTIATAFRALEICLALLVVIWISARLPLALRVSLDYLKTALAFAARPLVVFVLSNAIVAAVAAKSGRFSAGNSGHSTTTVDEFYDEIVRLNENQPRSRFTLAGEDKDVDEEVVYQDKDVIFREINGVAVSPAVEDHDHDAKAFDYSDSESVLEHPKAQFGRARLEKSLERMNHRPEEENRVLRRSETERCRMTAEMSGGAGFLDPEEDKLSNEEFERTIEAFIAKQLRFRQEESMAIVLHSH